MNPRKDLYFAAHRLAGNRVGEYYARFMQADRARETKKSTRDLLSQLLRHAQQNVPYYARAVPEPISPAQDPAVSLKRFPILTKALVRENFDALKSSDLAARHWRYNASGGSTGEPVRIIQDIDFYARTNAIQLLSFYWAGREIGEPAVRVWGSDRDILEGSMGPKMNLLNALSNDTWLNAYRMTEENMTAYLGILNRIRPRLIIANVLALYELAQFSERAGIAVQPQNSILTSAETLHPVIREKLEGVFQCRVFNRYGCREVGDIACECAAHRGLHVFPWGSFVEIVDDEGNPVPDGVEGNILVTSLANYAMPMLRYKIGDRGVLAPDNHCVCGRTGQHLERISGRITENFRTKAGKLIPGTYFVQLIGVSINEHAIRKFQVVQEDLDHVVVKIVKAHPEAQVNIPSIVNVIQKAMEDDVNAQVKFVDDIPPLASGKYLYTISRVHRG